MSWQEHNDMTGAYFMREGSPVAGKDSFVVVRCKSAQGPSDDIRWRKHRSEGAWARLLALAVALLYTRGWRGTPHTVLICRPTVCRVPCAVCTFVSRPCEPLSFGKADGLYITSRCNAAGMCTCLRCRVRYRGGAAVPSRFQPLAGPNYLFTFSAFKFVI